MKIVKQAAEEQTGIKSNRMNFQVLPDRGEVLCTRGKHAPANKGYNAKLHRKPPHDGVGWLTKLLPESAAGAFVDAAEADKPKVSFVTAVVDFVSGTFQPIIPALS